jgi:stage II sporulation protein E
LLGLGWLGMPRSGITRASRVVAGLLGGGMVYAAGGGLTGASLVPIAVASLFGGVTVVVGDAVWERMRAPRVWPDGRLQALLAYAAATVVAGGDGIAWGWWHPGVSAATLAVAAAGALFGPVGGAFSGAVLGLTLELRGGDEAAWVGALVVAGFLAGIAARAQWRLAAVGLAAGLVLDGLLLGTGTWLLGGVAGSMMLGAGAFLALPEAGYDVLRAGTRTLVGPTWRDIVRTRLARVADQFDRLSRSVAHPEPDAGSHPVQNVVRGVCLSCSLYRMCWEQEFYGAYRSVQDLLAEAESRAVAAADLKGYLGTHCIKPKRMAEAVNRETARLSAGRVARLEREAAQRFLSLHLEGTARLLETISDDVLRPARKPPGVPLRFTVGIAQRARRPELVSGDTPLVADLGHGRVVIGLSDGMGVGVKAARASRATADMVSDLLQAGFSETVAVRLVNVALLVSASEERFATLDIVLLDLAERQAAFLKVAAPPSFMRRGDQVVTVRGEAPPLGILRDIPLEPLYHKVEPGDILVLVSDGVLGTSEADGQARLADVLRQIPPGPADAMAEALLGIMLQGPASGRDDALVVVVRVTDQPEISPLRVGERLLGEWRRLTPVMGGASDAHRASAGGPISGRPASPSVAPAVQFLGRRRLGRF